VIEVQDNYFQVFDFEEAFDLDLDALTQKYRQLQSEVHPDKFADGSETERMRAVQLTSYLNQAYESLRLPIKRAAYLLTLAGEDVENAAQADLPMELLMEQMQLREQLDELPADESALPTLEDLKNKVKLRLIARREDFSTAIKAPDLTVARRLFHEMQFLEKLLAEINSGEERRLGY